MVNFIQDGPVLENTFDSDPLLHQWVEKSFHHSEKKEVLETLKRVGQKASTVWLELSQLAEKQTPELIQFSSWGKRIDQIRLSSGWTELEKEAAREGIVATAYERKFQEKSRPLQMALLYLFHPSSAFVSCPLAMTDGAARCLELLGTSEMKAHAFKRLTSRNPDQFWTSGQWMTEKTGGSDVSLTSTFATPVKSSQSLFELNGIKWFTSATTSQMALLLAKTDGASSNSKYEKAAGLSLFYLELRNEAGELQNIEVLRLKEKLGTKALPTAELLLKGAKAQLIGEKGQGVKNISTLLNITRIYNSICATSHMRRGLDLLKSYSQKRKAFGSSLENLALHQATLVDLEQAWARCFVFVMRLSELLGKEENQMLSTEEKIELRVLTPVLKLFTAKESMRVTSEVVEGFGGAGYIEDTGIPKLLRDAQVFSIWEGTTNVLSLDLLRALKKDSTALAWFQKEVGRLLNLKGSLELRFHQENLKWATQDLSPEVLEKRARQLSFSFAYLYSEDLREKF